MALNVWIAEDYEFTHERTAAAGMISRLDAAFGKDEKQYHLLCNILVASGSVDALLIKPDGFIIIELKSFDCPVAGSENGIWWALSSSGIKTEVKGGYHGNPFQQVRKYRFDLISLLSRKSKSFLDPQRDRFDFGKTVTSVVLFDALLKDGQDEIDLAGHHAWFRHGRLDELAGIVASITSSEAILTTAEMLRLVQDIFRVTPAKLIGGVPLRNTEVNAESASKADGELRELEKVRNEVACELQKLRAFMEDVRSGQPQQNVAKIDDPVPQPVADANAPIVSASVIDKNKITHLLDEYKLEFCAIDCVEGRLPKVLRPHATHELLMCVRSKLQGEDLRHIKTLLEACLQKPMSAAVADGQSYLYWPAGKWLNEIDAASLFREIKEIHSSTLPHETRYRLLLEVLDRITKQLTHDATTRFSNLYSRLFYISRKYNLVHKHIDALRYHANAVALGKKAAQAAYMEDLLSLCEMVAVAFNTAIPDDILLALEGAKHTDRSAFPKDNEDKLIKEERLIVDRCDDHYVYGVLTSDSETVRVAYRRQNSFAALGSMLKKGDEINLLYPTRDKDDPNLLSASFIVYDPDYLVSVTDLCACVNEYGNDARHYLIKKFSPTEIKAPLVLGNLAGKVFADVVTQSAPSFAASYKGFLGEYGLDVANLDDFGPGGLQGWLEEANNQFCNIDAKVNEAFTNEYAMDLEQTRIESEFISSAMGLNGRIDCLYVDHEDGSAVTVELKSGKEKWQGGAQLSHFAQVALYRDILYCLKNLPRERVQALLFYSKTGNLFGDMPTAAFIAELVQIRNQMVYIDHQLRDGDASLLLEALAPEEMISPDHPLFRYIAPRIRDVLDPIMNSDDLAREYFYRFLQFVMVEHFLAKTGDGKEGATQGFSKTWNATTHEKLVSGDIIIDLQVASLEGEGEINKVIFNIPCDEEDVEASMNFREGDSVVIYERNEPTDCATNQIIMRGAIERITKDEIVICLNYAQRPAVFRKSSLYAIEHSDVNSARTPLLGLHALLATNSQRRELLLGLRDPQIDSTVQLICDYSQESKGGELSSIVLQAKQAKDFYLLLGPPGSGKTHHALNAMVREFATDPSANILLMAYTNRAVDEICATLEKSSLNYIRLGQELKCGERYRPRLLKNLLAAEVDLPSITDLVASTNIMVGTISSLSSMSSLFNMKHFDVAIIDEAAQVLEPYLLPLLCGKTADGKDYFDKFIMIGDHKQLPAVTQQDSDSGWIAPGSPLRNIGLKNCRNSLFERLYELHEERTPAVVGRLTRQGRMHPVIGEFSSRIFYDDNLKPMGIDHQNKELYFSQFNAQDDMQAFVATNRIGFFPSDAPRSVGDSHKINKQEARIVAKLIQSIHQLYLMNGLVFDSDTSVGVIVPFRNQIAQIRKELHALNLPADVTSISIDTVERYQGSARDIIIFSTTISQPYQKKILSIQGDDDDGDSDNIPIDRKLNVAVTRAREHLFVTGNRKLLGQIPIYEELIMWLVEKGGSFACV